MLDKLLSRLSEPSSYAGVAAILLGAGSVFKIDEAPALAGAAQNAAEIVGQTGSPYMGVAAMMAGVVAILNPESRRDD